MPDRTKIYSRLLALYPARFREEYRAPMEHQFRDDYRDASTPGSRTLVWLHALEDLALSAPREILRELAQDLKHSWRVYRSRALSPILAILALGLSIGAGTGIFSVMNALLVRGLPFSAPQQLVELKYSPFGAMKGRAAFDAWKQRSLYLQDAATFSVSDMNLLLTHDALRVKVAETSANFFALLGTESVAGRLFSPGEDAPGSAGVAVISHSLWQQLYGGSTGAIGSALHLNGALVTVVGVAPPRFDYPGKTNVWTPTVFAFETIPNRGAFLFQTVGRLKPYVGIGQAREMFEADVRHTSPASFDAEKDYRPQVISLQNQLAGPVRAAGWVLAGMIFLVLLTASANVAQLLLSRTTDRRLELAIRAALGASRARLMQQLITEATALTVSGAALGLLVAQWTCRLASSIAPAPLSTQEYTILDWRVLAFAAGLAIVMGIVFGIMPAVLMGRLQPAGRMVRMHTGSRDAGARKMRAALIGLQAALTLILVASSITMGRSFLHMLNADLGFQPSHVVTLNVSVQGTRHHGSQAEWRYYSAALDRLRAIPGVESAGAVSYLPLADVMYMAAAFTVEPGKKIDPIITNGTGPGYFRAMGTPFLAGSDFEPLQADQSVHPVIVNEAFARRAGLGTSILGRTVTAPWDHTPHSIVGVVRTESFAGPASPGGPQIYFPMESEPPPSLTLVARVQGNAEDYLARCRDAVRAVDPQVPIYDLLTLDQRLDATLARPRFYTTATLFLAALAMLLAAIGVYGTTSYAVAQRTHEMGIRMALGATYQRVRTLLLRESLTPIAIGLIPGVAGVIASGQLLGHLLENAPPPQLSVCLVAAGLLLVIGLLACWGASARLLAVEPATAIRVE